MESISTEHLTFERDGATAIVTMNRPEAKNALSLPMLVGMKDAWLEIDANDDIRCAILTGAGGTFCAGMDLKAMGDADAEKYQPRMAEDPDLHWKALLRHYDLRKPLIAAVEGWAVAGGTEILQATDIRVAGESAVFGVFEAKRGLFPLGGSTVRLRRQIPYTLAMELLLTAREVPAEEALRIGLIGHVVPDGTALEKALEIAAVIGANGPLAVEAIKRSVRETEGMSEVDGLARELEIGWPIFSTNDATEGQKAFAGEASAQLHPHVSGRAPESGGVEGAVAPGRRLPRHRRRADVDRRRAAQPAGRCHAAHRRRVPSGSRWTRRRSRRRPRSSPWSPTGSRRRHRRPSDAVRSPGRAGSPACTRRTTSRRAPWSASPIPSRPPIDVWAVEGADGQRELRGSVTFGYPYEGPPTCVHGGVIAELFDEMLGICQHR